MPVNDHALTPDKIYGILFKKIQESRIFQDSKLFVDATPKRAPHDILQDFQTHQNNADFDLKHFIDDNFDLPKDGNQEIKNEDNIFDHISKLWPLLQRKADFLTVGSSLIPLPYPYIVPGGRFREIYYWDSYFTMLGLIESGKIDIVENMIDNFAYLIETLGHIPNGNRTYFVSRSQPPFFSSMVELLTTVKEKDVVLKKYLPALIKEYNFWMIGAEKCSNQNPAVKRVVKIGENSFLNRYWDDYPKPRQESYLEDIHLSKKSDQKAELLYLNIRAACESGWDFSSRWLIDPTNLSTIRTTEILPVDLNVLIWHIEKTLSEAFKLNNDSQNAEKYSALSKSRKESILKVFWCEKLSCFTDFYFQNQKHSTCISLATMFPLWQNLCNQEHADKVATIIKSKFLKQGGVVTSLVRTGQQWDAPNGWAPLQWITFQGLINYGHNDLAKEVAINWTKLNERVFNKTGKMMEKYNVEDMSLDAGGGEYPVQDGFGWTNGVFLAMHERLKTL